MKSLELQSMQQPICSLALLDIKYRRIDFPRCLKQSFVSSNRFNFRIWRFPNRTPWTSHLKQRSNNLNKNKNTTRVARFIITKRFNLTFKVIIDLFQNYPNYTIRLN